MAAGSFKSQGGGDTTRLWELLLDRSFELSDFFRLLNQLEMEFLDGDMGCEAAIV